MAEVKVKITAANQTQTGFQSVLADAQKTATQVQQTFARASTAPRMPQVKQPGGGGPIDIDIGDYGLGPLRELQEQLRQAREASKQAFDPTPTEQYSQGIGGVLGRFALLIGGAATVGKILASTFDAVGSVIREQITLQRQFNEALSQAGNAVNLSGAIAEFRQLNAMVTQMRSSLEESMGQSFGTALANAIGGRPGQLMSRIGSLLTFNSPIKDAEKNIAANQQDALKALQASLDTQINNTQDIVATGGDKELAEIARRQQEKKAAIAELNTLLERSGASAEQRESILGRTNQLFDLQDQDTAAQKRLEAEREISKEREKQSAASAREAEQSAKRLAAEQERTAKARRSIDQDIALTEAKLRGDKGAEEDILQQRDIDRAMEGGATFEQAANLAATNALQRQMEAASAAEGQAKMTGSFGASSLQRIGFASNEFFDTRRKEDPSKLMQQMVSEQKKTNKYLGDAGGLYLQPSS